MGIRRNKTAQTNLEKSANVLSGAISKHCAKCLNLNGCCFVKDKCPTQPLHPNCHCMVIDINSPTIKPECIIEKIRDYIFSETKNNGKKELFELWGYSIMDSEYLRQEFIKQAKLAYSIGAYELGLLNEYGQRINITITLKRKDKNGYVSFRSGWMVYPNGKIILTTPYGEEIIMKLLDRVELIVDKKKFTDLGLKKGDIGTVLGEERNGYWYVVFEGEIFQGEDGIWDCTDISAAVLEEDVKVIEED